MIENDFSFLSSRPFRLKRDFQMVKKLHWEQNISFDPTRNFGATVEGEGDRVRMRIKLFLCESITYFYFLSHFGAEVTAVYKLS